MGNIKLFYITNNPDVALIAEKHGVDRIWIDLETEGKEERQKGMNTVKSRHSIEDIRLVKPLLTTSEMLVRINPWSGRSNKEIDAVIDAGADIIMLPMWRTAKEVQSFVRAVAGRCRTLLLLETIAAERILDEVLSISGINEIFIGMNDLHIEYRLVHMLQLLANGKVEEICSKIKPSGIPFGFGGIGRPGLSFTPTPEEIISEHFRLGSTACILSRSFCDQTKAGSLEELDEIFAKGVSMIRRQELAASRMSSDELMENKERIINGVQVTVSRMLSKERE